MVWRELFLPKAGCSLEYLTTRPATKASCICITCTPSRSSPPTTFCNAYVISSVLLDRMVAHLFLN